MPKKSIKEIKNVYFQCREALGLSREAAAELLEYISKDRIYRIENGALPDVAPAYWRNYTDNMTWPGAFITVADMIWRRFGDFRTVEQHYDAMKRWMLHMKKYYLKDGILIRDT